jgi:hypothetical protein
VSGRVLSPLEFDFLWEQLQLGEQPYPLRVPSHGKTMDERSSLRHEVERQFKLTGVKNNYSVLDPQLDGWLRLLAMPRSSVDASHIPEFKARPVAALAASDGNTAVLAVQEAGASISLRPIFPDALASEVINLLPHAERGTARSITLSLDEALRTQPALVKVAGQKDPGQPEEPKPEPPKTRFSLRRPQPEKEPEAPRRKSLAESTSGDPRADYALLIAQPRLRGGQLAANARDEAGRKFRSPALAWFDTVTGRYLSLARTGPDGHEWVTVAAADAKTLRTRLSEMLASVHAQAR